MYSVAELLIRSYRLYRNNFWLLLGYAAWLLVPSAAFLGLEFVRETYQTELWFAPVVILVAAAAIFLGLWLTIILTQLADKLINEQEIHLDRLQESTWPLVAPLLMITILQSLIFIGGFLLLIIPGIIFLVWYALAQFSLILEGKRGMESLARSKQLTANRFWEVLWILFSGPAIITFLYSSVLAFSVVMIGLVTGVPIEPLFEVGAPIWVGILESIADVIVTPWLILYFTMLYIELIKHPVEKPSQVA